jgi:hypothetical protein
MNIGKGSAQADIMFSNLDVEIGTRSELSDHKV